MKGFGLAKRIANSIVNRFGYTLVSKGLGYFNANSILKSAATSGLSVCEYLEENNLGGVGKRRGFIITNLKKHLPAELQKFVEIGAGTGMYLEEIIRLYKPSACEVYETSIDWSNYLAQRFSQQISICCHNADGLTLSKTASSSMDVAFSHAVFVYVPLIVTTGYLEEMVRVVRPGGMIVFDCFLAEDFGLSTINDWRQDSFKWTFPVILSKHLIEEFIDKYHLQPVATFTAKYHASFTTYFVLRKKAEPVSRP